MSRPEILEKAMRPAVHEWMVCRCLQPFDEVKLGLEADIVGVQFAGNRKRGTVPECLAVVAVELKLDDANRAIDQAVVYSRYATESWVCMPSERVEKLNVRQLARLDDEGIGLLAWKTGQGDRTYTGTVRIVMNSVQKPWPCQDTVRRLWRRYCKLVESELRRVHAVSSEWRGKVEAHKQRRREWERRVRKERRDAKRGRAGRKP